MRKDAGNSLISFSRRSLVFFEYPVRQTIIELSIEIEHFPQFIKAAHEAIIDILLDLLQRGLVRHDGVPGENQDRVIDADGHFHAAESGLIFQKLRVFELGLLPELCGGLFVIIPA